MGFGCSLFYHFVSFPHYFRIIYGNAVALPDPKQPILTSARAMNMSSSKLDQIDRKVLEILQDNAKITNAQLSKEIGLSPAPTLERVKKLETSGVILSYHARLDRERVGLGVTTFVMVTLVGHKKQVTDSFVAKVNTIPEIIECHHITGDGDFLLKVISKDITSYQKLMLEVINEIEEVANTKTMVILSTFKESTALPLP